jgi:hypothetical protein
MCWYAIQWHVAGKHRMLHYCSIRFKTSELNCFHHDI